MIVNRYQKECFYMQFTGEGHCWSLFTILHDSFWQVITICFFQSVIY